VTPEQLSAAIRAALQSAVDAGDLAITVPAEVRVERPRNRDHGDWSTNIALQLAKGAGIPPRELATALATHLASVTGVQAVDVAGPGFLNITLEAASAGELARAIVEAGPTFGHGSTESGRVVNLEFISANPTGPLHIGHTRWAALGDAMRRLLVAAGAQVAAEYYINDAGAQMDKFGASVLARAKGQEPPEDGYPGDYVADRAARSSRSGPTCSSSTRRMPRCWLATSVTSLSWPPSSAPSTGSGCTSTCGSPSGGCTTGARSSRPWPACASRVTYSTTTVRCGCARPTSATTRTVSSSGPTAHPRTSPPTPRTT
jgi:hypothetical protein